MQAIEISRTALDVEWRRLEIISENLANANVSNSPKAAGFRELHLVSGPKNDFSALLDSSKRGFGVDLGKLEGVQILSVQGSAAAPRLVHEPGNPQADANGFVAYPSIDHAGQMTEMIKTSRAYEANIAAINAAHEMYTKALQLGERA
ncbi:MAG: flagellar basal body rod protein FlgC [Alphaproteobacteria bacterium]|nr:flagellar basal body rod protein FlgC [Alphaproteobacteria bacterium]MBV9694995.1 flagellar basal body rod protein FlgC [Alphaproteobacteria bacterium]